MNEVPHPGFDKPEEYETFTTTNYLEEAAEKEAWKRYPNYPSSGWGTGDYQPAENWESDREVFVEGFKFGAKWVQDQFEKNRLANCDKLTKEEYDRETDFAIEIIEKEHRQPTFTDAINYGMRVMKDQMMKEAVEGFVGLHLHDKRGDVTVNSGYLPKELGIRPEDKVKLIVIKED